MQHDKETRYSNRMALLAMLAACCAVFLTAIDQTVVVTALPRIITDLSINVQQLDRAAWIVSGYLLGYIIAMPLMGRISDMYGRRSVFLLCLGIFAAGSFLCGRSLDLGNSVDISFLQHIGLNVASPDNIGAPGTLSPGLVWLVAARFIQAIGGGALIPVAMAVAGDFYGEKQRSLALGLIGMVMETGGVLGPLYGALIVQTLGWQAIFYLNLPIVAVLAALTWFYIPSRKQPLAATDALPIRITRSRVDIAGALLLGASLACLSLGLSQEAATATTGISANPNAAPIQNNPWLIGASLLLLAVFLLREWWLARRETRPGKKIIGSEDGLNRVPTTRQVLPIVELSVFRRAAFSAAALVSLLVGSALIIAMVDIPFFIDTVLGGSALDSGLALLRLTAMIPVGALLGGYLCPRITCRITAALGLLLSALGFFLMHLWPLDVNWLQITASTLIGGFGFGLVIAPIGTTAINAVRSTQMGMASSTVTVLRMTGMIIGLAALTSWGLGRFHTLMLAFQPPPGAKPFDPAYNAALTHSATAAGHDVYTSIFLAAGIITLVAVLPALLLEGKQASPYALSRSKGFTALKRGLE
ncbi:MAG TPA: MFS transporter [Ktedonobacteraceae bacterium]|nr:MFS transporter [Ktedonobacteraceae bacterium]